MNKENTEKLKIKKNILIILLMFAIMILLPTVISSLATEVNGYTVKSISGYKTWNTDEDCAELYEFLYTIDPDGGTLPSYRNKNAEQK